MARFLALTFTLILSLTHIIFPVLSASPTPSGYPPVTLAGAEKIFLDSNLQLLAQRYNIDAQEALVIQARL